jgi:putative ABC transport system permease protein
MLIAAQEISIPALAAGLLLLLIPLLLSWKLQLGLGRDLVIAVIRMTVQLTLAGIDLGYFFRRNNPWL